MPSCVSESIFTTSIFNITGTAQLVWRHATRFKAKELGFNSHQEQDTHPFPHSIQTGSGAHSASYLMVTMGSVPGGIKWLRLATHHLVSRSRIHGAIHPLPHISSWHSASLIKHWDNLSIMLPYKMYKQLQKNSDQVKKEEP
jgi:hypothetical protein